MRKAICLGTQRSFLTLLASFWSMRRGWSVTWKSSTGPCRRRNGEEFCCFCFMALWVCLDDRQQKHVSCYNPSCCFWCLNVNQLVLWIITITVLYDLLFYPRWKMDADPMPSIWPRCVSEGLRSHWPGWKWGNLFRRVQEVCLGSERKFRRRRPSKRNVAQPKTKEDLKKYYVSLWLWYDLFIGMYI